MKTKLLLVLGMVAVFALNGKAQNNEKKFGFELSSGASFATRQLAGTDLKTGFGFEGIFHYQFMSHLGAYAGWGWNRNSAKESFAGSKTDFEETGYVFGLQFKQPIGNSPASWYARAAGLYNHIEIENEAGDIIFDTKHGFGWQLAGGVDVNLGRNWSLTPGIKFNALNKTADFEGVSKELNLNYLSARVGILKKF
jgi:opacity protein-like surface antigen